MTVLSTERPRAARHRAGPASTVPAVTFAAAGVPVAESVTVNRHDAARRHPLPPPYVLKPVSEGSSFGVDDCTYFLARLRSAPAGGLFAEELKGIFRKYENDTVFVEVDGKTKEYKVSPDAKFKGGKKIEILLTDLFKLAKDGVKGSFIVEDGVITKVTIERDKDKKKKVKE